VKAEWPRRAEVRRAVAVGHELALTGSVAGSSAIERVGPQDLMTLWPDDVGWPQDIGALAVLDGGTLLDRDGRFRLDAARAAVEARLHLFRRFREVLYSPGWGLGRPLWVDAREFDVGDHVRLAPLSGHGDEASLLTAVEQLRRRPLDRSRPLWELSFIPGLVDGQVGLYLRVHHVMADGPAAVALLAALFDGLSAPSQPSGQAWTPAPVPSARELFWDNVRRRLGTPIRVLAAVRRPRGVFRDVGLVCRALRGTVSAGLAPRTSLNQPIGPKRTLTLVRSNLELVKTIAHDHGATANDVLLTAIAGGARALLTSRGEQVGGAPFRAMVPVSLHRGQRGQPQGNQLGSVVVPLPVGEADPVRRLELIAAATAQQKRDDSIRTGELMRMGRLPRASVRIMAHQRLQQTYVSNVPGPRVPLHFAGAPVLEVFPIIPLIGNLTLAVGALSYVGQFNIAIVVDPDSCPDHDVFSQGVRDTLETLRSLSSANRDGERPHAP
jgi:diacylglycerol O-acyltransferase